MSRTLPGQAKGKNTGPTRSFVLWFYKDFLGYLPDATVYARHMNRKNPKALIHLFEPEFDDAYAYTPADAAELVYYLEDNNVGVDNPGIVGFPGLLAAFRNKRINEKARKEFDSMMDYLKRERNDSAEESFVAPEGW